MIFRENCFNVKIKGLKCNSEILHLLNEVCFKSMIFNDTFYLAPEQSSSSGVTSRPLDTSCPLGWLEISLVLNCKKRLNELDFSCWFHWLSKILEHTFCWIRRRRTLSRFFWSWTATRFLNEQNSYDINSNFVFFLFFMI